MPIIGPLPETIAPNTLGDATQVQANFDWIVAQVNANANPISQVTNFGRMSADLNGANVVLASAGVPQKILLDNVHYDPLAEYDPLTGIYTASQPGIYWIQWIWTPTVSGSVGVRTDIAINGTLPGIVSFTSSSFDDSIRMQGAIMYELAALDTVEFYAMRSAVGNSVSGGVYATYASVTRLA